MWQAYRRAFEDFSAKVRQVQLLTTRPSLDRAAMDVALFELEQARVVHNKCRDTLVQHLLPPSAHEFFPTVVPSSPQAYSNHVKEIAELLWESAGRPNGSADDDWRRAEDIVRRATAA